MLVHICCSVDSHFFLQKLQKDYPNEKLIGFFYDPNIHPYSEYKLRFLDVKRSCEKLGIDLIEGKYDYINWLETVKGLEKEKEKGKRCEICFDKRFEVSANKALELGEDKFTTTLLVSPLKSQEQLKKSGELFYKKHGIEFIAVDYRSNGGTQDQSRVSKEEQLYRQDYCGCIYGLTMQRDEQNRLMDEMFSPISNSILPASIEERLKFYKNRRELEEKNIKYKIIKQKFLNYRQFNFKVIKGKKEIIPAYALSYSILTNKKAQGRIEFTNKDIHYFNRNEIIFITLDFYNNKMQTNFTNINELIFSEISINNEIQLREDISSSKYNISPIVVVKNIINDKLTINLESKIYEDSKEKLIII
ncbi:MAG: epoxyqueuosine reductase QueH [Campylobacterota bacterium]|nr:epoxyqueuosine reductase QueH [Campylobacterota bacterium]